MWLHHKGCTSPLVEYVGRVFPIYAVPVMRRSEWRDLDGREFMERSIPTLICPDCGKPVRIHSDYLAAMDKTPTAFGLESHAMPRREARPSNMTPWLWFRHQLTD